jgi:hypothetical protein
LLLRTWRAKSTQSLSPRRAARDSIQSMSQSLPASSWQTPPAGTGMQRSLTAGVSAALKHYSTWLSWLRVPDLALARSPGGGQWGWVSGT